MRVLIVGAGIAGLTLAALLRRQGRTVDIVERSPAFNYPSYPLCLHPLGSRILHGLGAHRAFVARSLSIGRCEICGSDGRPVKTLEIHQAAGTNGNVRTIDSRNLLRLLFRAAGSPEIRVASTVEEIAIGDVRVSVKVSEGTSAEYDLVVGADGVYSAMRGHVDPSPDAFDTGWACWTWWDDASASAADRISEQWGRSRLVGFYPVPRKLGVLAAAPLRSLDGDHRKERIKVAFRHFKGPARDVLAAMPAPMPVSHWKIEDRRARRWVNGRVVLLGDAACSFLPPSMLGTAMALESAAVLADALSRAGSRDIPHALTIYERRVRARVESAQTESRNLARHMFLARWPLSLRSAAARFDALSRTSARAAALMNDRI